MAVVLLASIAVPRGTQAQSVEPEGGEGLSLLEAVELLFENDPGIAISEARLESSQGLLINAQGRFDPVLSSSLTSADTEVPLSESTVDERTTITSGVGLSKEFRSGLSIAPGIDFTRTEQPGLETTNEGLVSFQIRQPLMRGRGRDVVTAGERTAEIGVEASESDLFHTTSLRVLSVGSQYWSVQSAVQNLEILRVSEDSSRQLLGTIRQLVDAGVTPSAELVQLEANVVAKEVARIGGERSLVTAIQDLGREIGLTFVQIRELPLPSDPFPVLEPSEIPPPAEERILVQVALDRRADLAAARSRLQASEVLLGVAENSIRPQLDLVFAPSYSGFVDGGDVGDFFAPLLDNVPGLSTTLSLSLQWPTFNRRARGDLVQSQASRDQSSLFVEQLRKSIDAEVPSALASVRYRAAQVERAAQAVELFDIAVDNERKKLRAGASTVIDVISQEDRLTSAQQQLVAARFGLALALLELRFQTGTLLRQDEEGGSVDRGLLTTLPRNEAQ